MNIDDYQNSLFEVESTELKVEKTENKNEVKLSFTVEAEKFEEAMKKVYSKTA